MATLLTDGVVRLGTDIVNWYLVDEAGVVTVVDAAVPRYRPQLDEGLRLLGRQPADVGAVVLTHAHSDHVGCAEQIRTELGVPVLVHPGDGQLAKTAKASGKNEAPILPYLRHGAAWKLLIGLARGGALRRITIGEVQPFADGDVLDIAGHPRVVHTPGHTEGHCALHFAGRGVLMVGDLLATWNPLTGGRGPQLLPRAFNRSSQQMLDSLARIEDLDASVVAFGHGDPWSKGPRAAVEHARAIGPT